MLVTIETGGYIALRDTVYSAISGSVVLCAMSRGESGLKKVADLTIAVFARTPNLAVGRQDL
jgi:hypothetical protein